MLSVVDDQTGNPTSALDIADAILRIAPGLTDGGTYHLCGRGDATWCGFAREIFRTSGALAVPPEVRAITTAEYPTPATRPPIRGCRWMPSPVASDFGLMLGRWNWNQF